MDPQSRPPSLIVDPALPASVSSVLRASPETLRAVRMGDIPSARGPDPVKVFSVAGSMGLIWIVTNFTVMLAMLILIGFFSCAHRLAADPGPRQERRRMRVAIDHANRFILPEDLDAECGALLRRAQDAAETVLESRVNRAALLDTIDNAVTLPDQTWQIATKLVRLSSLRAEYLRIVPSVPPPEVAEAFVPYSRALETARASLIRRIEAMEEYAAQVRRADAVYHSYRQLELLAERTPQYEQLVADTTGDALAIPQLRELTGQARRIRELFLESMEEARRAAGHLMDSGGR
ncbi:hypothetical protein ACFFMN_27380 [Planobispora siamensis]|uniref:Uncharacterized protein n=1 Tax=Planobispora siamensis TaxID=936338 RepID=A0A8J3SAT3_9ACTN|nr:hypothetical protein [Planobispora siamensis]GIH90608.1 hypothetical protein Psi01_12380 [Planobispora siamensis]